MPKRTVIVLGAGASKPYGFPLGEELREGVATNLIPRGTTLRYCEIDADRLKQFHNILVDGDFSTLDDLLETRDDFRDVGVHAIAVTMLPLEKHQKIFPLKDWYKNLFDILNFGSEQTDASWLTIVTLNYDRSLEYTLSTYSELRFNPAVQEVAKKKLNSIKIIHAHGSLGEYPKVPYGIPDENPKSKLGPNYQPIDVDVVKECAKTLKQVADNFENDEVFRSAQDAIEKAEQVMFIGFGYDELTVKRLFRYHLPTDKKITGTFWIVRKTDGRADAITQKAEIERIAAKKKKVEAMFNKDTRLVEQTADDFTNSPEFRKLLDLPV
jgi:hypothetical protein